MAVFIAVWPPRGRLAKYRHPTGTRNRLAKYRHPTGTRNRLAKYRHPIFFSGADGKKDGETDNSAGLWCQMADCEVVSVTGAEGLRRWLNFCYGEDGKEVEAVEFCRN
jgi:hypothetical protein